MVVSPGFNDPSDHRFWQFESRKSILNVGLGEPVERGEFQITRDVRGDVESARELVESEGGHPRDEAPRNVIVAGGLDLAEELGVHVLHPLERVPISPFGNLKG